MGQSGEGRRNQNEIRFGRNSSMRGLRMMGLLAATLLVAFAGNTARVLGNRMGQILGQSVVVENRPGAGSNLAAEFVARSAKDGYTLFLPGSANIANAAINPNLPFDVAKDFAPVGLVSAAAVILVVHPSLAVNNLQELIALVKSKPGELSYASTGIGS